MTSSLKNSLHRRNHKERSQLAHRTRLGILEKHKDYVKRARDYHSKQNRLNRLKQKAADRNKDEFYFSMIRERTKNGVHIQSRGNAALPTDIVKVLKTQDENYVRTMRASGVKKIDKIKVQLTEMSDLVKTQADDEDLEPELNGDEAKILREAGILRDSRRKIKSKHILFAASEAEASLLSRKGKEKAVVNTQFPEQEQEEDLGWKCTPQHKKKSKRPGPTRLEEQESHGAENSIERLQHLDRRKRLLKELSARLDRDQKLRYAQREFEMQRLMMGKGARRKIQGVEKVEGDNDEEDEDEIDARRGKRRNPARSMDEEIYRPRIYKWRLERKK